MDDKLYYIKRDARTKEGKDAPWLMGYRASGMTEVMADGKREQVYTCLWGDQRRDAKVFLDESEANRMANAAGHCVVISAKKGASV